MGSRTRAYSLKQQIAGKVGHFFSGDILKDIKEMGMEASLRLKKGLQASMESLETSRPYFPDPEIIVTLRCPVTRTDAPGEDWENSDVSLHLFIWSGRPRRSPETPVERLPPNPAAVPFSRSP